MADFGPDYDVSRLEAQLDIASHEDTIAKGHARLQEIERQKVMNQSRLDLSNRRLDKEASDIKGNEAALQSKIKEIRGNLDKMVKSKEADNG